MQRELGLRLVFVLGIHSTATAAATILITPSTDTQSTEKPTDKFLENVKQEFEETQSAEANRQPEQTSD